MTGRRRRTTTSRSTTFGLESSRSSRQDLKFPSQSNGAHHLGEHHSSSSNRLPDIGNQTVTGSSIASESSTENHSGHRS
ncbi:hypothetical protein C8Q78DRAFT_355610 [Trametes maxima]|nr:hypothetical protein C8Q78DRAFT_355610 [Trametes maxima]